MQADRPHPNRVLAALPPSERERLVPLMKHVKLSFKEPVFAAGQPVEYLHFPLCGVISLVLTVEDGVTIETGTVGRESVSGLSAFLGDSVAANDALCQIPGEALRIPVKTLMDEAGRDRQGLEASSCECYEIVRRRFEEAVILPLPLD